jgi:hypothetical protein
MNIEQGISKFAVGHSILDIRYWTFFFYPANIRIPKGNGASHPVESGFDSCPCNMSQKKCPFCSWQDVSFAVF